MKLNRYKCLHCKVMSSKNEIYIDIEKTIKVLSLGSRSKSKIPKPDMTGPVFSPYILFDLKEGTRIITVPTFRLAEIALKLSLESGVSDIKIIIEN